MKFLFLLCEVIVLIFQQHQCHALSILIDNENGIDTPNCLTGTPPCRSLEYIKNNIHTAVVSGTNLTVTITSPKMVLQETISLSKLNNFTLQGTSSTTITCINSTLTNDSNGTGLQFINSRNLKLINLTLVNCTAQSDSVLFEAEVGRTNLHGILIYKSIDIEVVNVTVNDAFGYGLSLINNNGIVLISNCTFERNKYSRSTNKSGASGLLLKIDSPTHLYTANYTIKGCKLMNNQANMIEEDWRYLAVHGGGMLIVMMNGSHMNSIEMNDCQFSGNKARLGGGLFLNCRSNCVNNTVTVSNCFFNDNHATAGGGGADVGYSVYKSFHPIHNSFEFVDCSFTGNSGKFGGGAALFTTTRVTQNEDYPNAITFKGCQFINNVANGGAAVDVNPGDNVQDASYTIANFNFTDSTFHNNKAGFNSSSTSSTITQGGVFYISRIPVTFSGRIRFCNNQGSALYVSGATVIFKDSQAIFTKNNGERGGGVLLVGIGQLLELQGKNIFTFTENTASFGGAVCAIVLESRYFQNTDICFIKNNKEHKINSSFRFINNKATTGVANDIFVSNLYPCRAAFHCNKMENFFRTNCVGNFSFSNNDRSSYATSTDRITIDPTIKAIPGFRKEIQIIQYDQIGNNVSKLFSVTGTISGNTSIRINSNYVTLKQNLIILNGKPGDNATLFLQSNAIAVLKVSTKVIMADCPPGSILNKTSLACICDESSFIDSCTMKGKAKLKKGNWAGYISKTNPHHLATGACAESLCQSDNATNKAGYVILPLEVSNLTTTICGNTRQGVLCGHCIEGYTVYYHSPSFKCNREHDQCSYGVLLYLVSDILPVTLLFLVIIIFNVHITSGFFYSFIFYSQVLDVFRVDVFGAIKFDKVSNFFMEFFKIFYGVFNFKYFHIEEMSFCCRPNMNVLDIFALEFLTILYSLFLIIITLVVLKINSLHFCIKICHKLGRRNIRGSVINGLTAFVVLCYFKCVNLVTSILIPVDIHVNGTVIKQVALFNGELDYLKGGHLHYAVPAFLCFLLIIFPPPFLLLLESFLLYLNQHLKIKRNRVTYFFRRMRMKVLPFLDSFQGCFRNQCRCFAGLFFMYRIILVLSSFFTARILYQFIVAEFILFFILILHYLSHPFQKPLNNKIDIFFLVNLLIVNMITTIHFSQSFAGFFDTVYALLTVIQIIFMSIPALYALGYCLYLIAIKFEFVWYINRKVMKKLKEYETFKNEESFEENLPYRLLSEETITNSEESDE